MASDETMNTPSSSIHEDDDDVDDGYQPHPHNLSRLSMCTSSLYTNDDDDDGYCDGMRMYMSRLSIESFDADEELSDGKENTLDLTSDSDKEPCCYSLPATPPSRRNLGGLLSHEQLTGEKDYASENEAQKGIIRQKMRKKNPRRRRNSNNNNSNQIRNKNYGHSSNNNSNNSVSGGESEGGGLVVITRPKGGRRSLCMDMDEVKACRDLGFELEHERMLEMPTRLSLSGSTYLDTTSSGGNSPISTWRISSPGDDPRDVKARLKVWAQAVAIASTSRHGVI